jgi:hypothetical protein
LAQLEYVRKPKTNTNKKGEGTMPAKKRRLPRALKVLSIQELKAHIEASQQCERWARKGIELAEAGRIAEARAAAAKARKFMAKMIALEN